jgi:pyridoxal phosphate enzyme (YggS family)
MSINISAYKEIKQIVSQYNASLVAVSKIKPVSDILALYENGQRDFGENYVQEMADKYTQLPRDIHWHFIGHLQSNKVKIIAPFVHLVQSVDSTRLLQEINKQAKKNNRVIDCLLQVHIAKEETKFGFDEKELKEVIGMVQSDPSTWSNVRVTGLMGMASFTEDEKVLRSEFRQLKALAPEGSILSMGMSGDFRIALEEGSTMIRIGSILFGARNQS